MNLCVANEPPDELQQLPDDVEVAVLARLVQRTLALLVLGLRVAAVLQQRAQHHQVASRGRDVHRGPGTEQRLEAAGTQATVGQRPAVPHGQVGVRPALDQHLGALLPLGLVNPGRYVKWGLPSLASLIMLMLLL